VRLEFPESMALLAPKMEAKPEPLKNRKKYLHNGGTSSRQNFFLLSLPL